MINAGLYFQRFLGYQMGMISSDNLTPHNMFYESFQALDSRLLMIDNTPGAIEELGERSLFGDKDIEKAIEYLKTASIAGHGEASVLLSQIYRSDEYGYKDYEKYFEYVVLSANQGSSAGMFNLSCAYYKGKEQYEGHGFDQDKTKAFEWSYAASKQTREMIQFILSNNCSKNFQHYLKQQVSIMINGTGTAADQLIDGDGISCDLNRAKSILEEAQLFSVRTLGSEIPDFTELLKKISNKQNN